MSGVDLKALLAQNPTFIDVRAPGEFAQGAIPGATNLPLLADEERHEVGLAYRHEGQPQAIAKGEALVSGAVKAKRVESWVRFAATHEQVWLYCWRGGLRSQTAARWLQERAVSVPTIPGGFKALRHCCLSVLEDAPAHKRWFVLGGRTGSGKTTLITQRAESIDLEGLANHRGSAFGSLPGGQPTPVDFENRLAVAFLRHTGDVLLLEDESKTIGRLAIPNAWYQHMQETPLLLVEVALEVRAHNIANEYVDQPLADGADPASLHNDYQQALDRIRRRLGGLRHREVSQALARGFSDGHHEPWIQRLLEWYYDPMYDYQLAGKQDRVVVRGDQHTVMGFLDSLPQPETG